MKLAYSIPEASKATSLSRAYLYKLMAKGELHYTMIGRRRVIPTEALEALVNGQTKAELRVLLAEDERLRRILQE